MLEQFNVMLRTMAMLSLFAAGEGEETRLSEQFNVVLRIKVVREIQPGSEEGPGRPSSSLTSVRAETSCFYNRRF